MRPRSVLLAWLLLAIVGLAALSLIGLGAHGLYALGAEPEGWTGTLIFYTDLASHFRLQYLLALLLCTIAGGLLLRSEPYPQSQTRAARRVLLAGLGAALLNGALVAPLYLPAKGLPRAEAASPGAAAGSDLREAGSKPLSILCFNALTRNSWKDEVQAYVAAESPDIVALLEVDEAWVATMEALPGYRLAAAEPRGDNYGVLLLVAEGRPELELLDAQVVHDFDPGPADRPSIEARLRWQGRSFRMLQLHVVPPTWLARGLQRDRQLALAADWAAERAEPSLIMGDLNATRWSAPLSRLLHQGRLHNSEEGFGFQPSWPYVPTPLAGIPIDHLLHSEEWRVRDRWTGPMLGSDHRPLRLLLDWR